MKKILLATMLIIFAGGLWRTHVVISRSGGSSPQVTPQTDFVFIGKARLTTTGPDTLGIAGTTGFAFGTGDDYMQYAPGSFIGIRHSDGSITPLVEPNDPAKGNLIDVQSVEVSFDGSKVVFSAASPDHQLQFRIYEIGVDGAGFRQLTFNDRKFTATAYPHVYYAWEFYDDVDAVYLADGSIVFASTRRISKTHSLQSTRGFNLYRIFPGAGGAPERLTHFVRFSARYPAALPDGRILFSRWWNQFNQPTYQVDPNSTTDLSAVMRIDVNPPTKEGVLLPDGTRVIPSPGEFAGEFADFSGVTVLYPDSFKIREATDEWDLAVMHSDGSDVRRFVNTSGGVYAEFDHTLDQFGTGYELMNASMATVLAQGGQINRVASIQMHHGSAYLGIKFLARLMIYTPGFAAGPNHGMNLAEGRFVFPAYAADGTLYVSKSYPAPVIDGDEFANARGYPLALKTNPEKFRPVAISPSGSVAEAPIQISDDYDVIQFKPIAARLDWMTPMKRGEPTSDDPIDENAPPFGKGHKMATVFNPNIYAQTPLGGRNAPNQFVRSSPPIGRVAYADLMIDAFRFSEEDANAREHAMLWKRVPVSPAGAFGPVEVPAYAGVFVILRDQEGKIVHADSTWRHAIVAAIAQGEGYALPNEQVKCVGCHLHHQSGPLVDLDKDEAKWTNIAPSAKVSASSADSVLSAEKFVDRRALLNHEWRSACGVTATSLRLEWPLLMEIRGATIYGSRNEDLDPAYRVKRGKIRLRRNRVVVLEKSFGEVPPVQDGVLQMSWRPVAANIMEVVIDSVANGEQVALSEIEVMGKVKEVTTNIKEDKAVPQVFMLEQNYPNPFNPETQIRYHLPAAGPTKLAIFNLMGQEVLALVNGWQDAGAYTIQVDATHLPSGIYFYRLTSHDLHQTRKMVVSK